MGELLATLCSALGINHLRQNISGVGRPFKIAEGKPVAGVELTEVKSHNDSRD